MNAILELSLKSYLVILLSISAVIGVFQQGLGNVYLQLILAVGTAVLLDSGFTYSKTRKIPLPSSAFISGMIIALVLSPGAKWFIPVIASGAAILAKQFIRVKGRHIFNPANFGLLLVMLFFSASLTWWGQSCWQFILLAGLFICYKMKRLSLPLIFIFAFAVLNKIFSGPSLFDSLMLVNVFFVFVMLIEPKTSPANTKAIVPFACLTALLSVVFLKFLPQYDFSVLALAAGNILVPFLRN